MVDHTIDAVVLVTEFVGEPFDDQSADGYVERFDRAVADLRAKAADPELAGPVVESPFGALAFKQLVSSIVVHDLLVHTWDLARATGRRRAARPRARRAHARADASARRARCAATASPTRSPSTSGADAQTELLCFLGRRP